MKTEIASVYDEIDDLIMKYKIDRFYPRYRKNIAARQFLTTHFKNMKSGTKVVLLGIRAEDIAYTCECIVDCPCVIEKMVWDGSCEQLGLLSNYDKQIYVISFHGKGKMLQCLHDGGIPYEDIYELFEIAGLLFEDEFYKVLCGNCSYASWDNGNEYKWDEQYQLEYSLNMERYETASDIKVKAVCAEKLLFLSLLARDFILSEYYVRLVKESGSKLNIDGLPGEIDSLLSELEERIKKREEKDILTFWIDAVPYGKTENMTYWNEIKDRAVSFDRAYTVTPQTKPALRAIFCEKREVRDAGYKVRKIDRTNSRLIRFLEENGYGVKTISGYFGAIAEALEIRKVFGHRAQASLILWNMVRQLAADNAKQFIICHFFAEPHYPYISMSKEGYDEDETVRRIAGEKKVDEQLKFYSRFIPDNASCIYMSDHGKERDIGSHHINIDIITKEIKPRRDKQLISIMDFYQIVFDLVKRHNDIEINKKRTSVPIEALDYYSRKSTQTVIEKKLILLAYQFGYMGEVYQDYIAMCFSTGIKWAVSKDKFLEAFPNAFEEKQAVGVAGEVIDTIPDFPYELLQEEKFVWSRLQHSLYDLYTKRIKERMFEIEKAISKYPDGGVAVRMGGVHSMQLYRMLSSGSRNKIGCFIDNNPDCLCEKNEKKIVSVDDFVTDKDTHIRAVILSSYKNIDALRKEAVSIFSEYDIVDIYGLFDRKKIKYKGDFYNALYDSDYRKALNKLMLSD